MGNIKFDGISALKDPTENMMPLSDRPIWLAGSTHPGEEEIILKVFAKYKKFWRMVIVPRHIERTEQILSLIASKGMKAVRFSDLSFKNDQDGIVVVDTIGQLKSLYAQASLVFVGKSLCVGGGHNIIEPAVYAKAVIIGPMMQNFRDITAIFLSWHAVVQVKDAEGFEQAVDRLISDEGQRKLLGERAAAVVKANQGATVRILQIFEKWL
jgi:3-deoxy-D-manno-octulosonic-acid transferase